MCRRRSVVPGWRIQGDTERAARRARAAASRPPQIRGSSGSTSTGAQLRLMLDDPSDQAVASRFFGGQPEVAPGVLLDPLEGLSGLLRELAVQPVAHLENLTRLDLDIAGGPAGAARRLVQQEARVREAVAVFARHRDVDQGRDARHPARADHAHPWAQKAHEVVNRVPRLHVAALRVDEHRDLLARLPGQGEQLCPPARGDALGDLTADDHRARAKQPLRDEVVRRCRGRFQGGWGQLFHRLSGVGGHRETPTYVAAMRRCRSSSSARVTYTRVICFRHDRSKSVLSIGFAGRYAASAAAAIASSDRSVPASAAPASGTSCGQLATPPNTIRASATRPWSLVPRPASHLTHAATPSTGKSNASRRRSLWYTASHPSGRGSRTALRISSGCLVR